MPAANPLVKAIKSGIAMNDRIGDLFAKIGNTSNPNGIVYSDYMQARLAIQMALRSEDKLNTINSVLKNMNKNIRRDVFDLLNLSVGLGADEANRQLSFYGLSDKKNPKIDLSDEKKIALNAIFARIDSQSAAVRALSLIDAEDEQIVGDGGTKNGVLRYSEIFLAISYWITFLIWAAFDYVVAFRIYTDLEVTHKSGFSDFFEKFRNNNIQKMKIKGLSVQKQAVAVIDERTTECCLMVHGQVQNYRDPFILKGRPRYADKIQFPAFHDYCRTSIILYVQDYDNGLTETLLLNARNEIENRKIMRDIESRLT